VLFETRNAIICESAHPWHCVKLAIKCVKKGERNPQAIEDECSLSRDCSSP